MIYNLKQSDPTPSTRGFTRQLTVWDKLPGRNPVSFEMLREISLHWQSRALNQRADVDWMFVSSFDTTLEPKGLQRTVRVTTWVQADPTNLCPPPQNPKIRPIIISLPGQIKWTLYKPEDTVVILRSWLPLTPVRPGGLSGIELWVRNGMNIDTSKTWAQNRVRLGTRVPTPYEIYPSFEPSNCWRSFQNTTYISPQPSYTNVIEFCNNCIPKNCSYPNPHRRLWSEQCCSPSCGV